MRSWASPPAAAREPEFDHPGGKGSSKSAYTTYRGDGGIPIGSTLRRLLFAVQDSDPNIFFSSELNSASQLLTVRDPRARVAKVAPWLTLDGDVYPAVVNGEIKWIVDGYTSSSNYPDSQLVNLRTASTTTLTANGASIAQPSTQVNYLQNSVKAVVDAYTGKVTLYAWNQAQHPDPLLTAWESVFPGLVQPQSSIPSALLPQLRYPTDLFNVQRYLLTKYHVTQPTSFYSGNDFWKVPTDPTVASSQAINATSSAERVEPAAAVEVHARCPPTGSAPSSYSLSSPLVTLNGQQLAAFISVDAKPGPDYGKFTVLNFPSVSGSESPAQVQNDIESNTTITEALTLQRGGNSTWCWATWRRSPSPDACSTSSRSTPSRAAARRSRSCATSSRCTATATRRSRTTSRRPSTQRSARRVVDLTPPSQRGRSARLSTRSRPHSSFLIRSPVRRHWRTMTELLMLRHALPVSGHNDPGLSDVGRAQAERVAQWLKGGRIDGLLTSPLRRARETAAPIEAALGLTADVVDGLREWELDDPDYTYDALEDMAPDDPRVSPWPRAATTTSCPSWTPSPSSAGRW